jgi:polyferredoxin
VYFEDEILQIGEVDTLATLRIGGIFRSKFGRFIPQLSIAMVAFLIIYDGLTGPQLAPRNSATIISWVIFRGLIILTLIFAGNFFCMACPFALTRTIARKLSIAGNRWPQVLRNKWISIGTLFLIFWLYEWLDLWESPWLTAWIVIAYFVTSIALEAMFSESPFCKYVCPLGAFNFVHSSIAPLQISARDSSICQQCDGKECVNGSDKVLGCGTELFVPTLRSNMDCTLCLDCSRACPYDNVGLIVRKPFSELILNLTRSRWDHSFLLISLSLFAILNAFGMVSPIYSILDWMESTLGITSEGVRLFLVFTVGVLGLTSLIAFTCGKLGESVTKLEAKVIASRYSTAFVPLGAGIWIAHYGFHFLIGALTIIPAMHAFLIDRGIELIGSTPNWDVGFIIPMENIFPFQVGAVFVGFFISLYVLGSKSMRNEKPSQALMVILPWAITLFLLTVAALSIFNLPMEMRGMMGAGM